MADYTQWGGTNGGTYASYYHCTLSVWEIANSVDVSNNTSRVGWSLTLYSGSSGRFSDYYGYFDVYVNGVHVLDAEGYRTLNAKNSSLLLGSGELTVEHTADGSKTISSSFSVDFASGTYSPGDFSQGGDLTLTTIPRASSITATDANIESATTININRASSNFTHTITYSFYDLSGTIVTKTSNTSVGWIIPSSFYAKIPNSKTGTVTLTCTTYNGNTNIGSKTTTFTITASESTSSPTLTATLVDINSTTTALSQDNTKLIKYKSTARITPTATARNSATITSIKVNGVTVSGSYIEFQNVESETFEVTVTDSRGYTNSLNLTPTIIQYIPLTSSAFFQRTSQTSSTIEVSYSGNYFNNNFSSGQANTLTITWKYKEQGASTWQNGGTLTATKSGNTYSGNATLGSSFDYQKAYDFILYVSDRLSTANYQDTIKKGTPIYDYGVDSNGNNYHVVNGDSYIYKNEILSKITGQDMISVRANRGSITFTEGWTDVSVPNFTAINTIGSKLTISNGKVKVGKGVSKVVVFAINTGFYVSTLVGDKGIHIQVNGTYVADGSYYSYPQGNIFPLFTEMRVVNVQENDLIGVSVMSGAAGTLDILETYLFVQVVE